MGGKLSQLQAQVTECVEALMRQAVSEEKQPDVLAITGNTTMLYLLCGIDPESLSHAPFPGGNPV